MEYIFSQVSKWDTTNEHKHRLYAYPNKPKSTANEAEIIILDSGAYGLSKAGKSGIPKESYQDISDHYAAFPSAFMYAPPDHFLSPKKTIENWEFWHKSGKFSRVSPVIQFYQKKALTDVDWQIEYYLKQFPEHCKRMFISNPGLRGLAFLGSLYFQKMLDKLRAAGVEWLHVLGAGWDIEDILDWCSVGIDSLDSVAWYNNAKTRQEAQNTSVQFQQLCEAMKSL